MALITLSQMNQLDSYSEYYTRNRVACRRTCTGRYSKLLWEQASFYFTFSVFVGSELVRGTNKQIKGEEAKNDYFSDKNY